MSRDCPAAAALTRASSEGADAALTAHLAGCARCAAEWHALAQVVALVRETPAAPIDASRRESVRTAVLLAAAGPGTRRPRRGRLLAGVALAAAAVLVAGVWVGRARGPAGRVVSAPPAVPSPEVSSIHAPRVVAPRVDRPHAEPPQVAGPAHVTPPVISSAPAQPPRAEAAPSRRASAAEVVAEPGARFVRLERDGVEVVRVDAGRVRVVAGKTPVRVESHGGAVRITDASVIIAADGERLVSVEVQRGEVRLERRGAAALELGTGDRWDRDQASVPGEPSAPSAPPAPPASSAAADFQAGLDALRRGDHDVAAAAFARAAAAPAAGALAEDAYFWRGVALARADRDADAEAALRAFLRSYPGSARAGEASAILGWILVERGALAAAEPLFRAAAGDPVPAVRDSGARGLRELARRRAPGR